MNVRLRVLNLGAGVQSSVLLYLAIVGRIPMFDHVIFADTGAEPAAVYAHLEYLRGLCKKHGIHFYVVARSSLEEDIFAKSGTDEKHLGNPPFFAKSKTGDREGMLRRKCTEEYKIVPIERKVRELLGVKPRKRVPKGTIVERVLGISMDEVIRMKQPRKRWVENHYPLIGMWSSSTRSGAIPDAEFYRMTREQCVDWTAAHGFPSAPRSACVFCPYRSNREWSELADSEPEAFGRAVLVEGKIKEGIPGSSHELFLHRSLKPIVERPFDADPSQRSLFGDECEGLCGV